MNKLLPLIIQEGITHIEDLSLPEFIQTIETLGDKVITEKLDGGNLWFGLDETGVYTSREGKSPKKGRFYSVNDISKVANYNAFRSAHKAIEAIGPEIKKNFQVGDQAEIEILYGRQPNTVTYGVEEKSFIVILRGVNGTPDDRVRALASAINNKQVSVKSEVVSSDDGDSIKITTEPMVWEFTKVQPVDSKQIDTKEALVRLEELKKFLNEKNSTIIGKNNKEVAELSLTSIPKERRDAAKEERDRVKQYILDEFKNPIKDLLLNKFVRKIKPFLQAHDLDPSEDIGVEGVVIADPVTGAMTKIVDKEMFTAINTFNSSTRNSVTGLVRTSDQDAALEMRGGIFGQAKIKIANELGAKELALPANAKKFILKFKGDSKQETLKSIAASLDLENVSGLKSAISDILEEASDEINQTLSTFKKQSSELKLRLKAGKEIKLTPEVIKRTLTAFAETKKEIQTLNNKIVSARSVEEVISALYGNILETLFDEESQVKETFSLMRSIIEDDGATTSADIAPMANRLMANTVRRARNPNVVKPRFMRPVSMPLLKAVHEDANAEVLKFSTKAVDSEVAKKDVEFSALRNNVAIGGDVTNMDVSNYLDKAHELNNEVDSKVFGMEMSDGKIAKVYVAATEADGFEAALAELLGKEKDLEQVISDLADKFDIVDVVWPSDDSSAEVVDDQSFDPDADMEPINTDIEPGHFDDEEITDQEAETISSDIEPGHFDGDDSEVDNTEDEDDEVDDSEDEVDDSEDDDSEDEDDDSEDGDDDSEDEDDDSEDEVDGDDDSEDEVDGDEVDGDEPAPKRKKKPTPKEESMSTLGQKFTKALLEAKSVEKEDEHPSELDIILKKFTRREEKAIVKTMIALGLPMSFISRRTPVLKELIQPAADQFAQDAAFKVAVTRFLKIALSESAKSMERQLHKKTEVIAFAILEKLGINDEIVILGQRDFTKSVRDAAAKIALNASMHAPFLNLARALSVDTTGHPAEDEVPYPKAVRESVEDKMTQIENLLLSLGLDLEAAKPINKQLLLSKSKMLITSLPTTTLNRMAILVKDLESHNKNSMTVINV